MNNTILQKPCKEQSEQGFYVTYQNRSLYSKYNPSKNILSIVENLTILPGTLILAVSPVLNYGLKELEAKLDADSCILAVEAENALREFIIEENTFLGLTKTALLSQDETINLPKLLHSKAFLEKLSQQGLFSGLPFRRVMRVDFSAGAHLNKDFYDMLFERAVMSVKQYWANRVTLQRFGRTWHKNLFTNLSELKNSIPISKYITEVRKPIVVIGAGKGAEDGVQVILENRDKLFVLCVDTAYPLLQGIGIIPDGIVLEEAQNAIRESFIGAQAHNCTVFASLSSVSHPVKNTKNICYFATEFSDTVFLNSIFEKGLVNLKIPPYGSVGLSAVKLALSFRANETIPVFTYGLDFSFETGTSHARGTSAHRRMLRSAKKNKNFENYSCFSSHAIRIQDKNNKPTWTLPVMKTYRDLFENVFSKETNLWDCSPSGLELGIPKTTRSEIEKYLNNFKSEPPQNESFQIEKETAQNIENFLLEEINALKELKSLLTGKGDYSQSQREQKISELAKPREYLYCHFPDGYAFSMEINFLKRISANIDYFLKVLC